MGCKLLLTGATGQNEQDWKTMNYPHNAALPTGASGFLNSTLSMNRNSEMQMPKLHLLQVKAAHRADHRQAARRY